MQQSTPFHGLPTLSIGNDHLRIDVLAEAGPRIVRLMLGGADENQLAEMPDATWDTPYGTYWIRGGHRLWHAPEAFPRSYIPDNQGLIVEQIDGGLRLTQPPEPDTGIRKRIEIALHADRAALTLTHTLENAGLWPVELAPWAITQLPLGGVAVLPFAVPGSDPEALLPDRQLVLWPYTRWSDPRLGLHDDLLLLRADAQLPPCKVGYLNHQGWVGYLRGDVFFCKRFAFQGMLTHPDFNCNVECFCNHRFIELETLGTLIYLSPGQSTEHVETWEWHTGVDADGSPESIRALIAELKLGQPS